MQKAAVKAKKRDPVEDRMLEAVAEYLDSKGLERRCAQRQSDSGACGSSPQP